VHGGNHDKFFVGGRPVEVPRHNEAPGTRPEGS
jgi:hypothetical protein